MGLRVGLTRVLITEPKVIHLEGKSPNRSNTKRIMLQQHSLRQ